MKVFNKKVTISLLVLVLAVALLSYKTGIIVPKPELAKTSVYQMFETIELAVTPEEQMQGLMWREDLCDNCGMLFVLEPERAQSMWMKDTPTSLDMFFIDKYGTIVELHKNTVPFQTHPTYSTKKKVKYVLEMKAGFADRAGLKRGMRLDMGRLMSINVLEETTYPIPTSKTPDK